MAYQKKNKPVKSSVLNIRIASEDKDNLDKLRQAYNNKSISDFVREKLIKPYLKRQVHNSTTYKIKKDSSVDQS